MEILSMCIMLICYDINGDDFRQPYPDVQENRVIIHEKDKGSDHTDHLKTKDRYRISDYMGSPKDKETRLYCFESRIFEK